MKTYGEYRSALLKEIIAARREYFRLKGELADLTRDGLLPDGCYIGTYKSNYDWQYYALGHKNAVLPSATYPSKLVSKRHLGREYNPNYRRALLEIEKLRVYQAKRETFQGISNHILALKAEWHILRKLLAHHKLEDLMHLPNHRDRGTNDLIKALREDDESVFQFVKRQHSKFSQ